MGNQPCNCNECKKIEQFGGLIGSVKRKRAREAQEAEDKCKLQCGNDLTAKMLQIADLEKQLATEKQACELKLQEHSHEMQLLEQTNEQLRSTSLATSSVPATTAASVPVPAAASKPPECVIL